MRYCFKQLDLWEELKAAVGDIPCNITDTGDEMLFDFGDVTLTSAQEMALTKLMSDKPMLRGKRAKFVKKEKPL